MNESNKTYDELCDMNIGDMNKDELYDFALGLLDELWCYEKKINKAIKEIEYFELKANHLDDEIYLDEELSNKLLDILRGEDNENESDI